MLRIVAYKTVQGIGLDSFDSEVQHLLEEGWDLYGKQRTHVCDGALIHVQCLVYAEQTKRHEAS